MTKVNTFMIVLSLIICWLPMKVMPIENPVFVNQEDNQPESEELEYSDADVKIISTVFPYSLNCFTYPTRLTCHIFNLLYESLLVIDPVTKEIKSNIASDWTVSDDGATIEFKIRNGLFWSDGVQITAHDVLFSLAMRTLPGNPDFGNKVQYMGFTAEVISDDVIRFTTNHVDWRNLPLLGFLNILPAHAFNDIDFLKLRYELRVFSGQYVVEAVTQGALVLRQNQNWWKRPVGNTRAKHIIYVFSHQLKDELITEGINCEYTTEAPLYMNCEPESYGSDGLFNLEDIYSPSQIQHWKEILDFLNSQEYRAF